MFSLYIEDIVGNAFIHYLEKTGNRTLSLGKIEAYGNKVVDSLNTKGFKSRLVLGRDYTREFLFNYSGWFKLKNHEITLSNNVDVYDLVKEFSGYLAIVVLNELHNKENIKELF